MDMREKKISGEVIFDGKVVKLEKDKGPVEVKVTDSVSEMLNNIPSFIKASKSKKNSVGFVLDIDLDIKSRWQSICSKLEKMGLSVSQNALSENGKKSILAFG